MTPHSTTLAVTADLARRELALFQEMAALVVDIATGAGQHDHARVVRAMAESFGAACTSIITGCSDEGCLATVALHAKRADLERSHPALGRARGLNGVEDPSCR